MPPTMIREAHDAARHCGQRFGPGDAVTVGIASICGLVIVMLAATSGAKSDRADSSPVSEVVVTSDEPESSATPPIVPPGAVGAGF